MAVPNDGVAVGVAAPDAAVKIADRGFMSPRSLPKDDDCDKVGKDDEDSRKWVPLLKDGCIKRRR